MASPTMDTLRELAAPGYLFNPNELEEVKEALQDPVFNLLCALKDDGRIRSESKYDAEIAASLCANIIMKIGAYDEDDDDDDESTNRRNILSVRVCIYCYGWAIIDGLEKNGNPFIREIDQKALMDFLAMAFFGTEAIRDGFLLGKLINSRTMANCSAVMSHRKPKKPFYSNKFLDTLVVDLVDAADDKRIIFHSSDDEKQFIVMMDIIINDLEYWALFKKREEPSQTLKKIFDNTEADAYQAPKNYKAVQRHLRLPCLMLTDAMEEDRIEFTQSGDYSRFLCLLAGTLFVTGILTLNGMADSFLSGVEDLSIE